MKREQAQKTKQREKVKHFFGYKVNDVELAIIETRLRDCILESAQPIFTEVENNIYIENQKEAHLEISFSEFCPFIDRAFRNFEKWLADETWRRP